MTGTVVQIDRNDLRRATPEPLYPPPLAPGQARFRVDSFALTANNVTYAAHGDDLHYWRFYPGAEGFGIVPVWGFGTVEESRAEGVAPGDRFYGYWPMATHAVLSPVKVSLRGFSDGAAHRDGLAPIYNNYQRWTGSPADEAPQALFRPLYTTSFLLADRLSRGVRPEAVLMSSASSKTALGLAKAIEGDGMRRIGLTSPRNRAFVEATGAFDQVLTYDEIDEAEAVSAAYVDFCGDPQINGAVHAHFGDRLAMSIIVGDTRWDSDKTRAPLAGPAPEFFFAPTYLVERLAELGPAEFDRRLQLSWDAFVKFSRGWLHVVDGHGPDATIGQWARLVDGSVDPAEGLMLSLWAESADGDAPA
ncbi:DUF2855 family protein [Sphingoaurantiacus capsulatus]|uniref:DUF2855 family protein n=1 Tax=Sphingoaurantiacus capsulatus TaxID=1771310 RepID=A0ABV7XD61_9SPHN